jgi:hypothetical protein
VIWSEERRISKKPLSSTKGVEPIPMILEIITLPLSYVLQKKKYSFIKNLSTKGLEPITICL